MTSSRSSTRRVGVTCVIVISPLQFGQISIVGTTEQASLVLMPFLSPDKCRGEHTGSPSLGACHSEKQELARSLYGSGSISRIVRPLSNRVEENDRLRSSIATLVRCGCSYRS